MSVAIGISIICLIKSVQFLIQGAKELGMTIEESKEMQDCHGKRCHVDYLLYNQFGEKIGVRSNKQGQVEFVVEDATSKTVQESINKVTQAYARLKILDEVKRKGYSQVKEEKLPDGSIRMVVQRWR